MKVFKISHTPKPKAGRYSGYAGLSFLDKDTCLFPYLGKGRPFQGEWKPIQLYIADPANPRPDIFGFPGGFVCDEAVFRLLGEPLEMSTEVLSVSVEGEAKRFYACHITNSYNAVDKEKSLWRPPGYKNGRKMLITPAFIPEKLGDQSLFKIPDDCYTREYCLERSGDAEDGEFKALVDSHNLTGLEFKLVWSDAASST